MFLCNDQLIGHFRKSFSQFRHALRNRKSAGMQKGKYFMLQLNKNAIYSFISWLVGPLSIQSNQRSHM